MKEKGRPERDTKIIRNITNFPNPIYFGDGIWFFKDQMEFGITS